MSALRGQFFPARNTYQNRVVILRRSDARRAKEAGIVQPKNPVEFTIVSLSYFSVLLPTGSFTARRPTAFAHAVAPFRMTPLF